MTLDEALVNIKYHAVHLHDFGITDTERDHYQKGLIIAEHDLRTLVESAYARGYSAGHNAGMVHMLPGGRP